MKKLVGIYGNPNGHWVGDGFAVQSLFSNLSFSEQISPFLMLDYAAPRRFDPASAPRGVGAHPHRGFETVTFVYRGEIEHRDSTGGGGAIGPGAVQWMTAGSGLLHDEFHSQAFTARGGEMEMVQLWVNLPAAHKMAPPRYQAIEPSDIPTKELENSAGQARLIAGAWGEQRGPAQTFTPINAWDLRLNAGAQLALPVPQDHTSVIVCLEGKLRLSEGEPLASGRLALLSREGAGFTISAGDEVAKVLVLSGEPIDEPISAYGPFVMNTQAQIAEAIDDFNSGTFGRMPAA